MLITAVVVLAVLLSLQGQFEETGATPSAACPSTTARELPGGGRGSVLAGYYETDRFFITLCRDVSGNLYYNGVNRSSPTNGHLTLPARVVGDRVEARNGDYLYEVGSNRLRVLRDGDEILNTGLRPRTS